MANSAGPRCFGTRAVLWALLVLTGALGVSRPVEAAEETAPPRPAGLRAALLPAPPRIDGDLAEWQDVPADAIAILDQAQQILPDRLEAWGGPRDLSARVRIGAHGGDLFLAVSVEDDRLFHDPDAPYWHGDSLEVFFDFDREAGTAPGHEYTDGCMQLYLMPLNPSLAWSVVFRGPTMHFSDAGLRDVDIAHRVRSGGYDFEARIPLTNFGVQDRHERTVGFALAFNDADEEPTVPGTYLSWNAGFDLWRYPDHFGTLTVPERPAPATIDSAHTTGWPLWVFVLLAVALGTVIVLAGPGARWLAATGARPKWIGLVLVGVVALLLHLAQSWSESAAETELAGELEALAADATTISADARALGALTDPTSEARSQQFTELLAGGSIPCRPGVEAVAFVPLQEGGAYEDGRTKRYSLALDIPRTFPMPVPVRAQVFRVTVERPKIERSTRLPLIGTLTFVAVDGSSSEALLALDPVSNATSGASVHEITVRLETANDWATIRYVPGPGSRGAILRRIVPVADGASPLLLAAPTEEGIPVLAHAGGLNHGRSLAPKTSATFELPDLLGGADRLWVLLSAEHAFPDLLGDIALARLTVEYDTGDADERILRNGQDLAAERMPQGFARSPSLRSRVAYRWDSTLGYTYVHGAIPIRLATERRPRRIAIENIGPGGRLDVVAMSAVRTHRAAPDSRVHVVADDRAAADRIHLVEGAQAFAMRLEGLGVQDGVTLERALGVGDETLALHLSAPLPASVTEGRDRTRFALLVCLAIALILFVLLAVDAAEHFPRLARRLGFGVLAAALVPLAVTIYLVDRTHTERVAAEYTERARSGLAELQGRLDNSLRKTQRASRWLARDLGEARDPTAGDVRRLVAFYGARALPDRAQGSAVVAGVDLPPTPVTLRTGGRPLEAPRFLRATREPGGFYVSPWDGLVLVGAAQSGRGENRVRVSLGVQASDKMLDDLLGDALRDAGASVAVLDPRGHVLARAGNDDTRFAEALSARTKAALRRLTGGRPAVLGKDAKTPLAVAAALPSPGADGGAWLALGFDRAVVGEAVSDQRITLIWLAVFGLILIVSVASLMARRVAKPIGDLLEATEAVRRGSFDVAVPAAGADEVGQLTVAFDQMRLDLKHRVGDLDFLRAAQDDLAASLDLRTLAPTLVARFATLVSPDRAVLLDAEGGGSTLAVLAQTGDGPQLSDRPFTPGADGWLERALGSEAPIEVRHDDSGVPREAKPAKRLTEGLAAWTAVPLVSGEERQGVVLLGFDDPDRLPRGERGRLLVPLAGIAAAAMNNARLYQLAALDDVTHLPGSTAFEAALRADVEHALRGGPDAVLLRVGLDRLEHLTLRRGVAPGRQLLAACADALRSVVGDRSLLGRLRESQLAVRQPGVGAEEVRRIASAIRERLARIELSPDEDGESLSTTVSIGIARAPSDAKSVEFLLDAAGRALQAAQREGGDTVEDVERVDRGAVDMPPFEEGAIFRNERMVRLVESARRAARSDATVLITGETGTGKEVIATLIHRRSARADRPYVTVNCAAFPETLLESELFGHERGAFTGAERRREGRFELADGGTLFLDEIAEMSSAAQVKLLRVLQERQFTRLGGTRTISVDIRIIAATNKDLEQAVAAGTLREDLYYRLNVIRLELPPLRERREEIPHLVEKFLNDFRRRSGHGPSGLTSQAMDVLYRHPWPGNVRELKNAIERCAVLCESDQVGPEHLQLDGLSGSAGPLVPRGAPSDDLNPRQRALLEHLARHGRCTNRAYTEMTGTSQRTALRDLQNLMERGLIVREGKRRGAVYRLT